MELEKLKEKLGEDYAALEEHVNTLVSQRDQARSESISQRKALKTENAELKTLRDTLFEKLGISDVDEIDSLPTAKGAAEAQKQYEARIKKMERELGERDKTLEALQTKWRDSTISAALAKSLSKHEWIDRDVVELAIRNRLQFEDDEIFYRADEGQTIALDEGVSLFAKQRPQLVKSAGNGGSGYQPGAGAGKQVNPFAKDTWNLTQQGMLMKQNPQLAAQLMEAAKSAA